MSDKSFGDHANRNIVKNPLLSTAVTGLSIEDLTHNAVLLPAAPTQGLTTRSEQQIGSHAQTLRHPDNELTNHPSGDSNSNILPPHYSTTTIPNILDPQTVPQDDRVEDNLCLTQSKALLKSEDDFDVNEYFARLHGTRYVSAPLNSQIADQNANLATEENLEEINLNEEKPEIHQSLTADIAQNFSQLPAVLPHVASAVFSSFSSMLSLKSREQTPDDGKVQGYHGIQAESVPLMGVDSVVKEAAPPPKDPPVTGPSNFRIASKKKYAQIPGLSSGDTHSIAYNAPSPSFSSYFTPTAPDSSINLADRVENMTLTDVNKVADVKPPNYNASYNIFNPNLKENERPDIAESFNIYNPIDNVVNLENAASNYQPALPPASKDTEVSFPEQSNTVIPPPPMFSTQKRESESAIKSVLPPSVARRIGSNHPVIKQQTIQCTSLAENIFVPTFDPAPIPGFPTQLFSETTVAASQGTNPSFPPSQPPIFNPQSISDNSTKPSIPISQPTFELQPPTMAICPPKPPPVAPMFAPTSPSNASIFTPPNVLTSSVAAPTIFTPTATPETSISSQYAVTSSAPGSAIFDSQTTPTVPPTFYNPSSVKEEIKTDLFAPTTEPNKPLVEPPKATGVNYRMTKKRPQYYSGPIEGVGDISNNTKPIIPTVDTGTFQGAMFTPDQEANVHAPAIPFDISQTASVPSELNAAAMPQPTAFDIQTQVDKYPPFDVKPQEHVQSHFDTAFDLSRPTTDYYEEPKENKGFGIIGSLKSKLSAIDINKIQNTVTTFFDPAYNESKKDDSGAQECAPYKPGQYGQGSFEIFVPNVQNAQRYGSYDENQSYYQNNQYYSDYYQNQDQAYAGYNSPYVSQNQQMYSNANVDTNKFENQLTSTDVDEKIDNTNMFANTTEQAINTQENIEKDTSENTKIEAHTSFEDKSVRNFFNVDPPQASSSTKTVETEKIPSNIGTTELMNTQIKEETMAITDTFAPIEFEQPSTFTAMKFATDHTVTSTDENKPVELFTNTKFGSTVAQKLPKADSLLESISKDEIPIVGVSSVPLFGLSTITTETCKDITEISDTITSLYENKDDMFDRNASVSFFENIGNVEPIEGENVSELNICETCREFNKSDETVDNEVDDWTTQLIENITSRIQLSNPVEAPLTEPNVAANDNIDYENNQYDEISHITEETIETIQVQSATELLDDEDEAQPRNYGWATEEDFNADDTNINLEHDYSFAIDPNTIGFYGNNSLFFDNVPTNASDEIKAEFKHHEDLLPRQMSIPSAPPAEEDTKSDETGGLDVHSIEQDAKKDFPIYEEFVIEPSETDDDKIEYRERERSDDSQSDTFTNRVERFKKMEEVESEDHKSIFDLPSPPITMASYFDTGNFAVETHYRNSLSSPTPISIPPGFEEEYKKRLLLSKALNDVKTVPETSTQTRTTQALTFSTAHNIAPVGFNIETNRTNLVDEVIKPPYIPFDIKDNIKTFVPDISAGLKTLVEDARFPTAFDAQETMHFDAPSLIGDSPFSTFDLRHTEHTLPDITSGLTVFNDPLVKKTQGFGASDLGDGTFPSVFGFKDTNISSELIKHFVQDVRDVTALDDQDDPLPDVPTSLLPSDLVEDANFATTFDATVSKLTTQPQTEFVATKYTDVADISKESGDSYSALLEKRYFSTVGDDRSKDNETEDISTNKVTASLFGDSHIQEFDPKIANIGLVSNLFEDKKPLDAKDSYIEPKPGLPAKLFDNQSEFKPDETKHIATAPDTCSIFRSSVTEEKTNILPEFSSAFSTKLPETPENDPKLPDPNNFFTHNPAEAPESFSRLASYFSTPPKTDHGKSFFELSQSQNHYRHAPNNKLDEKYLNLMKDLTAPQNIDVKDQIIRHVNYFTVEYDSEIIFNKGDVRTEPNNESANANGKETLENIFAKCKHCLKGLNIDKSCKFRKAMDDNSKESDKNSGIMDSNKDTAKMASTVNIEGITHDEANEGVAVMSEGRSTPDYASVKHHWFYRVDVEDKSIWRGFSLADSRALEMAYSSPELNETTLVATDGGRYDVNIMGRLRIPVYWDDKPTNVRRCSWFYKGTTDPRYVPYTEQVAEKLEEEYRHGMTRAEWHRRLVLPNGEVVVMHGPGVMVHFLHSGAADTFSSTPSISRPRVVRRGHDESEIEDTEPSSIDHLLLLCHGVGSACDMRFRSVEEVVEDFRATSLQLLQSHYRNSYDKGIVNRVEVLPISWHASLHSGETGVDRRLAQLTLDSIPRLRHFTNDTLLDVLFYTSPVFSQTIVDTVCSELNRIYKLFKQRNPNFKGGVSLGGHSLGSVILYDLLCHQSSGKSSEDAKQSEKTYVTGSSGVVSQYPTLAFSPDSLYALGSPIAIFECIRGVESLGLNFSLPTCKNFFNIFHPYDPIAYRIEPLINPELRDLKPFLIPHHKGRKRMHLELKDTMARVGADLKQKLLDSLKTTWNKWKALPPSNGQLPNVTEEEIEKEQLNDESKEELPQDNVLSSPEMLGRLNSGRRVDYVLQEAPLEMINEYIFAMSSHVGYWESEDTMLLMLREIYDAQGVQADCTVPQHTLTLQRTRAPQDEGVLLKSSELPSTSHSGV